MRGLVSFLKILSFICSDKCHKVQSKAPLKIGDDGHIIFLKESSEGHLWQLIHVCYDLDKLFIVDCQVKPLKKCVK